MRTTYFQGNGINPQRIRRTAQGAIRRQVVHNDLGVLQNGHFPANGIIQIGPNVMGIDPAETGRMQIQQVVKITNDAIHQAKGVDLAVAAIGPPGHHPVEVGAIDEVPFLDEQRRNIDYGHPDYGSGQVVKRNFLKKALNQGDTVDFISPDCRGNAKHRTIFATTRYNDRDVYG